MIKKLTIERKEILNDMLKRALSIIADLYSDPTHFIFEILQNAEDTKATMVSFQIIENNIIIEHNGKLFDIEDIQSITDIANSTKKEDINKIGKFGAGFKSVFAITDTPQIHSGKYHFKIEDYIVPIEIKAIDTNEDITKIILPLKNTDIKNKVSEKLKNLEIETLLFLNSINEIQYKTENSNGHYIKDDEQLSKNNYGRVFIVSEKDKEEESKEFFIINDNVVIEDKSLKISIAYSIENNKVIKSDNSFLSVFFPTKEKTNLNFLLQAPYRTTPNRETIPFDNEQNIILTESLAKLVAKSLEIIKLEKLFDVDFLNILPIEKNYDNDFYIHIFNEVKVEFEKNSYIPTNMNTFEKTKNILLARGKELTTILKSEDLKFLWDKINWANTNITLDKTPKLRDYFLKELNIEEITYEKFARNINVEFLEQKDDKWLSEFYYSLLEQEALFRDTRTKTSILKNKNIIKLEDSSFTSLYDENDKLQVYRQSSDNSEYKTVKSFFFENAKSKEFFDRYNVSYPNKFSELKEFIYPKYENEEVNVSFEEYRNDIEKIINIYNSRESEEKKIEIIKLFENSYIILSTNNTFLLPKNSYMPIDRLTLWFENIKNIDYINNEIYNDTNKFIFELFGCLKIPKRIEVKTNSANANYKDIKENSTRSDSIIDYDIDNLENNLNSAFTLEKSILLWEYLLEYISKYSGKSYYQPKFNQGIYKWFFRTEQSKKIEANFIKLLKMNKWIYDKNDKLVQIEDISIDELNDLYISDNENISDLERIFNFKSDDIKEFEINHPTKRVINEEEYELLLKVLQEREENNISENDTWKEDISPNDITDIEVNNRNDLIETEDLSNQFSDDETEVESDEGNDDIKPVTIIKTTTNQDTKNNIGDWGQKLVLKKLENMYPQSDNYIVVDLNKKGSVGKGYDFVITKNSEEVLYIEVKSKVDEKPQLISITGTQWEWARKLYDNNQGSKFEIYVVSNAGTKQAKITIINNPIQQWKDGKLKAHPVNFEL